MKLLLNLTLAQPGDFVSAALSHSILRVSKTARTRWEQDLRFFLENDPGQFLSSCRLTDLRRLGNLKTT